MRSMFFALAALLIVGCNTPKQEITVQTVCNPMDLSYRFRPEVDEISRREAADPTVVKFKGEYYLFASKSGGYWNSSDLVEWNFIETNEIPTEDYAPTTIVIGDTIYLAVSSKKNNNVYSSTGPKSGKWKVAAQLEHPVEDPAFYLDGDGRLYLYWGCSNVNPLYASEIDKNNFQFIRKKVETIFQNPAEYGWEVRGDYNTEYENAPWLEGCWVNKHNNLYYLQYSAPGTREKSYADGVYVGESPLGPFKLAQHNPFAYKPEGFACGAGHGSTFYDGYGNLWHTGTISISVKHKFERRIGFYSAAFDEDGVLYANTKYSDYPTIIPNNKVEILDGLFSGWMLLSYKKPVSVSSQLIDCRAENALDENVRSYWSAETGEKDEWMMVDLESEVDVYALQVNFAEHKAQLYGRVKGIRHRYIVQSSLDGKNWDVVVDQSESNSDNSHNYHQLKYKVKARYVKVKNIEVPGGTFAISGLRAFGLGNGEKPVTVSNLKANRLEDKRAVELKWDKSENATGYVISYGEEESKLYHSYMVYSDNSVTIRSLNVNENYFFTIEAFNENGITQSVDTISGQ